MKLHAERREKTDPVDVTATCPQCGTKSLLQAVGSDYWIDEGYVVGQRRCPDPRCRGHLFVVLKDNSLVRAYPAVHVEYDPSSIPEKVNSSFEEALDCFAASCHMAAAMMVRRTLEEICANQGAMGANLKERIEDLGTKIVIPQGLLDGMDELRLLGNDAAHIEAQAFEEIDKPQLEAAIALTIELMKALYQYSALLEKLRKLKKDSGE